MNETNTATFKHQLGKQAKDKVTDTSKSVYGNVTHAARLAQRNRTEFYKLLGRLIPTEVSGPDGGPIEVAGIERIIRHAKD